MALWATALLLALGASLLLLGTGEATLAARDRDGRAAAYAAQAAATAGLAELRALPSWGGVVAPGAYPEVSSTPSRLADSSLTPAAPWGRVLDLRALTARLQSETDAAGRPGDPSVWRLFAYAPLSRLVPAASNFYLLVWVADDTADGDGDPSTDKNGILILHAETTGPDDVRAIVEASVSRQPVQGGPDLFRILSIRPNP
jgi:hypothetical protein